MRLYGMVDEVVCLREWDYLNCHSGLPIATTCVIGAIWKIPSGESSCKPKVIIFPSSILFKWCSMVQFGFSFFYLDLLPLTANADNVYASQVRRR